MSDSSLNLYSAKLRIHLIGVAGSGMSGLARLLLEMGHVVSGSDKIHNTEVAKLIKLGLIFSSPHYANALDIDPEKELGESNRPVELVVHSAAIRETNPIMVEARKRGLICWPRAQCLSKIINHQNTTVVAGTHGKTTTTTMLSHTFKQGLKQPNYYVGAETPVLGESSAFSGADKPWLVEGDESDGTLALYETQWLVALNLELEHLDFYRDETHLKEVFGTALNKAQKGVIYCAQSPLLVSLINELELNAISYGFADTVPSANYLAKNLKEIGSQVFFNVEEFGEDVGEFDLSIPGRHNVLNALATIALSRAQGLSWQVIKEALASFSGAKRRFDKRYASDRFTWIDDYAHHPSEIEATLKTAKSTQKGALHIAFQPHRYTRTQAFMQEFAEVLSIADAIYILPIYAASEDPIDGVSHESLAELIRVNGHGQVTCFDDFKSAQLAIGNKLKSGETLLTLGAGNIHQIGAWLSKDWEQLEYLQQDIDLAELSIKLYEPMTKHTTLLIGGCAQFWIEPQSKQAFAKVVARIHQVGIALHVVGRGSNLLVKDGGIKGATISLAKGEFIQLAIQGLEMTVGAGVRLKKIANTAKAKGLVGFEWMEGVPGQLGGSLRMNAGAMGREMFDHVVSITLLTQEGEIKTLLKEEFDYGYRSVGSLAYNYVLEAVLEADYVAQSIQDEQKIINLHQESRKKRLETQPIAASGGCSFKNPESIPAGKLIDELGMKGCKVGQAQVSDEHGNFIVNRGGATAQDVLGLIEKIREQASSQKEIRLNLELQVIGDDEVMF